MKQKSSSSWLGSLAMGTWKIWWIKTRDPFYDDEKAILALRHAYDSWIRTFDSAEMYAGWYSETLLWKALSPYPRSSYQLTTKVRGDNCSYRAIKKACENSLRRLWVSYIDLYYIHWRDDQFSLQDCMQALNELIVEWKIMRIGVSNFSLPSLQEAQKYAKTKIFANQVHYNMMFREAEKSGLLQYCQEHKIDIVAWRPLEKGFLQNEKFDDFLKWFKEKYKANSAQIALAWLLSQKGVLTTFMSTDKAHIDENIAALNLCLDEKDLQYISENFPEQYTVSDHVPLS